MSQTRSYNVNPVNFCYWLQGARELCGLDAPSADQVSMIRRHLDLVPRSAAPGGLLTEFIDGLRAAWAFGAPAWANVWLALDGVFEHVIDKMASGDQAQLNTVHGSTFRC